MVEVELYYTNVYWHNNAPLSRVQRNSAEDDIRELLISAFRMSFSKDRS